MSDLNNLFFAEENIKRWRAESENASARLELASMNRNIWYLLSQHEPIHSLGIDRQTLRKVFAFVKNGSMRVFEGATDEH